MIAHTFLAVHCTFLNNSHLGINLKNNNDKTNKKTKQNKAKTKKKKRQKEKRKLACVAWQLWSVAQTSQCGGKKQNKTPDRRLSRYKSGELTNCLIKTLSISKIVI